MADGFKVQTQITRYDVTAPIKDPESAAAWSIQVERRDVDRWAVTRGRRVLSCRGTWDHEMDEDASDEAWLAEHRFPRGEAIDLAVAALPFVTVNGKTVADILADEEAHRG